ncbi:MAG: hypothetical protein OH319_04055 [Candidatus Parvarchaeota archaeon]|nr:hypothetical protein [Candidatus Jingweiarchaeum tengchongense]MCW1298040.1 hypothetical protein [Candidatus Jingweiarchaeum tengchongense]MCW1300160.1 hypothetical protein [Candidatus Jingweiarchaeum tengchongense]MCW1304370.1 hypothetical protein [Candidatus Jingweiarchaeum tengchongense]MCW1305910.1 hypothetical protein [Candidatus Jingweiarchaeum tengchongense]
MSEIKEWIQNRKEELRYFYCEIGNHRIEIESAKCKFCGKIFCDEHGNIKEKICLNCVKLYNESVP